MNVLQEIMNQHALSMAQLDPDDPSKNKQGNKYHTLVVWFRAVNILEDLILEFIWLMFHSPMKTTSFQTLL